VFLFVDMFDNVGTLVGVGKKAGLFDKTGQIPRLKRILLADASATVAGSLAGTSTVVSYIESAAGVVAGGRSGVTAIVTGLLFIAALFVAPLVGRGARGGDGAGVDSGRVADDVARGGD
jgi:AGZA family xanthine/uracil permease-like MFS transporter